MKTTVIRKDCLTRPLFRKIRINARSRPLTYICISHGIHSACEVPLSPAVLCGERGWLEAGSFQRPLWSSVGLPSCWWGTLGPLLASCK